ncbi:MAG: ribonuclease P protein component [Planctomycetota bacterium]
MTDLRAGRRYRVRHRADIDRLFSSGSQVRDDRITVIAAPNGLSHSRLGVAVSKRSGSAVARNRIKRLIREAFRLSRGELPDGMDFIVMSRPGLSYTLPEVQASLRRLAPKAAEKTARVQADGTAREGEKE